MKKEWQHAVLLPHGFVNTKMLKLISNAAQAVLAANAMIAVFNEIYLKAAQTRRVKYVLLLAFIFYDFSVQVKDCLASFGCANPMVTKGWGCKHPVHGKVYMVSVYPTSIEGNDGDPYEPATSVIPE